MTDTAMVEPIVCAVGSCVYHRACPHDHVCIVHANRVRDGIADPIHVVREARGGSRFSIAFAHAPVKDLDRFVARITVDGDCWVWTGPVLQEYGVFHFSKRQWRAHRLAWTWACGLPLPDGRDAHVHHRCRRRRCVNPDHLELVQAKDHGSRHSGLFFGTRERLEQNHLPVSVIERGCGSCGGPMGEVTHGCNACHARLYERRRAARRISSRRAA